MSEWISVKDRLPECYAYDRSDDVLTYRESGGLPCYEISELWGGEWIETSAARVIEPSHWMELTEPQKPAATAKLAND